MKGKFEQIREIIKTIDETAPNHKAKVQRDSDEKMRKLEQEFTAKNREMKARRDKVLKALQNTIDLEKLSHRVYEKYFKFIDTQVKEKMTKFALVPKSCLKKYLS